MESMWGTAILDEGFTQIPNMVIRNWTKVGVKAGEWALITAILTYKHDHRDPYPSQEQLAEDLSCHINQIKRWIKSLKEKKLIRVGRRRNVTNKRWDNSVYNFKPLLDAIMKLKGETPLPDSQLDFEIEWEDEPDTQNVSMDPQQIVSMDPQQIVSPNKKREKQKREKENNNNKPTRSGTQKNGSASVVVEDNKSNSINSLLKVHGLTVTNATLIEWKKKAPYETIIQVIEETLSRDGVDNPIGYITKILENGYTPSPAPKRKKKDLPEYMDKPARAGTKVDIERKLNPEERRQAIELLFQLKEIDVKEYKARLAVL